MKRREVIIVLVACALMMGYMMISGNPKKIVCASAGATAYSMDAPTPTIRELIRPTFTPDTSDSTHNNRVTASPAATKSPPTVKYKSIAIKTNNSNIKLYSSKTTITYKIISRKNIIIKPSAGKQPVFYQIVNQGSKVSNKSWKKAGKEIVLKEEGRYSLYLRTRRGAKYQVKKTSGICMDKTAPKVYVNTKTYILRVTDKLSGVKYIKVNDKKVKGGIKLKPGVSIVEVSDKAGNRKRVLVRIS